MDITTAKKLATDLLNTEWNVNGRTFNLTDLGWSFKGFDKAVRRLGVCYGGRKQIGLSRKMTELRTKEEVEQTIRHEIGHAVDHEIRGYSAHDNTWKRIARQCGYNGETKTKVNEEVVVSTYKWVALCETHGILGGWTRKPKDNKLCRSCREKVLIVPGDDPRVLKLKK
jgi:predicted SprT family Zn-dependent metalloprotease